MICDKHGKQETTASGECSWCAEWKAERGAGPLVARKGSGAAYADRLRGMTASESAEVYGHPLTASIIRGFTPGMDVEPALTPAQEADLERAADEACAHNSRQAIPGPETLAEVVRRLGGTHFDPAVGVDEPEAWCPTCGGVMDAHEGGWMWKCPVMTADHPSQIWLGPREVWRRWKDTETTPHGETTHPLKWSYDPARWTHADTWSAWQSAERSAAHTVLDARIAARKLGRIPRWLRRLLRVDRPEDIADKIDGDTRIRRGDW